MQMSERRPSLQRAAALRRRREICSYITNTDCEITLKDVAFTLANDVFLRVEGNSSSRGWGAEGANGGDVTLTADSQEFTGNILVDDFKAWHLP